MKFDIRVIFEDKLDLTALKAIEKMIGLSTYDHRTRLYGLTIKENQALSSIYNEIIDTIGELN